MKVKPLKVIEVGKNEWAKKKASAQKQYTALDMIKISESSIDESAPDLTKTPIAKGLDFEDKVIQKKERKLRGAAIETANYDFSEHEDGIGQKFAPYQSLIENLTNAIRINTEYDVISCDWTHDGERFIAILKKEDEFFQVRQYCAMTFQLLAQRNLEGDYIKAQKVVQNRTSSMFAVCYLMDGRFKVLTFTKEREVQDIDLSKKLGISEYTRPNDNFPYPHMDACFLKDGSLFVNLYRTYTKQMVMLKLNPETGETLDQPFDHQFPDT